jgi:hypothetical protein
MQQTPQYPLINKFARALLATTCLSAASGGAAMATVITVTEGSGGAPLDFSNISPGYLLPLGTGVVNGVQGNKPDDADWFEFQGLLNGSSFSATATSQGESSIGISIFDSSTANIGSAFFGYESGKAATLNGFVPTDGNLLFEIFNGSGNPYSVALTDTLAPTAAPEPATLGLAGLAIAGALAWRRTRKA